MHTKLRIVAVDADDTLWQNEEFFRLTQDRFAALLEPYIESSALHARLLTAERKNIGHYGYGIKGFMLSMIETAIDVSKSTVPSSVIREILELGQDMLDHPIHLLPGVADTLPMIAEHYQLILITKGDLLHQEQKIARSGLGDYFADVHIVSEKSAETYMSIFERYASQSVMIGNSMKSDIVPAIEAGASAIHIPARYEWDLERADDPEQSDRFYRVQSFCDVAQILTTIG